MNKNPFRSALIISLLFLLVESADFYYYLQNHSQVLGYLAQSIFIDLLELLLFALFVWASVQTFRHASKVKALMLVLIGFVLLDLIRAPYLSSIERLLQQYFFKA